MLEKLSLKTKKLALGLLMLLVLYLAYLLSFKKAISAAVLNAQLKAVGESGAEPPLAIAQLEREHGFYLAVLKGYQVRSEDRESRLWQSVSGMAITTGTAIGFSPETVTALSDTATADSIMLFDSFTFSGRYNNLVRLLDTLSKAKGIGRIAAAKLGRETASSNREAKEKLVLKLKMAAIRR
ncbi:hypothetical protein FFJ24_010360 [Pedobacter sp. KBS0701]|uniref:hypothetical protein n=1 Tax=Pedobacter sp. KBS0701 TaxID=2578106 RepID=UPI00110EA522|nr:hypothetical protein [Pedobacter sp. KBS0701]QDW25191.1 hypothetical protein FFJ24_010360 [Pedobacter sp. KBS0701]